MAVTRQGINPGQQALVIGTLTSLNDTVQVDIGLLNTIGVFLSGTFSATIVFEVSPDGNNWFPTAAFPFSLTGAGVTAVTGANQLWSSVAGVTKYRVRASAFVSGTVNVILIGTVAAQTTLGQAFNFSNFTAAASTTVKTGAGLLHSVSATAGGVSPTITVQVLDNATQIYEVVLAAAGNYNAILDVSFSTSLVVTITGLAGATSNATVSWL